MALTTNAAFVEAIHKGRLLEPQRLDELTARLQERFPEPRALARHLLERDWLTPYQVNQLLQGRGAELVLGQYVLLERLGEGGMGQVFKARHRHLDRVVALKVIRKEHLDNADAIRRFRREIQAAAQLTHPNIVMAYDADQVGATHIFVMEYVAGVDLSTLLKQCGPPPVEQTCDYLRQTALGLQHACERGMVHRDIKPANLLVACVVGGAPAWPAAGAVLKILDMGVARIQLPDAQESISALTKEGRMVGTPDYMAPEQAVNPHTADIRADLYSLGCTGYQLLTGQVPFPGGTMMEKLLHHRLDLPRPIEGLRPQVLRAVCAIAFKLLAKRPEDRYQTPGELADALAASCTPPPRAIPVAQPIDADTMETGAFWTPEASPPLAVPIAEPVPAPVLGRTGRRGLVIAVVGLIVLGAFVLFRLWPRK